MSMSIIEKYDNILNKTCDIANKKVMDVLEFITKFNIGSRIELIMIHDADGYGMPLYYCNNHFKYKCDTGVVIDMSSNETKRELFNVLSLTDFRILASAKFAMISLDTESIRLEL